jgi:hypothetical protein
MNKQASLLCPSQPFSRAEILSHPCPVPAERGVYAWFFKEVPPGVPTDGCILQNGLTLLYVGISPSSDGGRGTLRSRLRQHMRGNAEGSTLRLSLGCLLSKRLKIRLQRVGGGTRLTFGVEGEAKLSSWMDKNAFVAWKEHPKPWAVERRLLKELALPLNLDQNDHPYGTELAELRKNARDAARSLPIGGK